MQSLLDQKRAAQFLGLSVRTLERHRVAGTGPRYSRLGRLIRYRPGDLTEWVEGNLRYSTSESVEPQGQVRSTSDRSSSAAEASAALKGDVQ
jgi:predicted DNA-binding transcriptional regulator AlpA